ncbi:MAG TPA: hypothetical protein VFW41_04790 [Gaiellaceae bacterium]|nr:hypothetical protein [Gaiellaceae bacterium]
MSETAENKNVDPVSLARELIRKGGELFEAGRHEDAFAAWEEVVERFGDATDPEVRQRVALALLRKGFRLSKLDRSEDAVAVYDELAARFRDGEAVPVAEIVAQALLNRALVLGRLDRRDEEIEAYDDLVDRFGTSRDPETREHVAWALYDKAVALRKLEREEESIAVYDELAARFGAEEEAVRVAEVVAKGLLNRALAIGRLGRPIDEIEAYEDMVARYGDSNDPKTRRHVAWALYDKAVTLRDLDRVTEALAAFDELVARFQSANEEEIRPRVSWGLWSKSHLLDKLGRSEESAPIYDELIARGDEKLDPSLGEIVIWCLWEKQSTLDRDGTREAQLAVLNDLISRFADSDDEDQQSTVVSAFGMKAYTLGELGREQDKLETYDELVARFGGSPDPAIVKAVAQNLDRKALALDRLDRVDEALIAYDEALTMLDRLEAQERVPVLVDILFDKAKTLWDGDREAEAVVVFDSTVTAYVSGVSAEARTPETTATAVLALLYKVLALAKLEPGGAIELVPEQLLDVLGDARQSAGGTPERTGHETESDLASLLAEVHGGDCWLWFATADNDASTRAKMAERALDLYRRTDAWLNGDVETWEESPVLASFVLRNVADGYAILSRWWSDRDRSTLPLPTRPLVEWTMRLAGIDEWAAEQGHPLDLRESTDDVEAMLDEQRTKMLEQLGSSDDADAGDKVASAFVATAHNYDLFRIIADSERGREAARDDRIRAFAGWQVSNARAWGGWARERIDEAGGATAAMVLMTQSFFVVSHGAASSSAELFPNRSTLRELLKHSDSLEWLRSQEAELPSWLSEDEE